jgi:hypothetical protein
MTPEDIKNAFAAVSAIAAIATCIGVIYKVREHYIEKARSRPNFTFLKFGFERPTATSALSSTTEILDWNAAKILGNLINIGLRPAKNVRIVIMIFKKINRTTWETTLFPTTIADDIQPNMEWEIESPPFEIINPAIFKEIDSKDYCNPGFYIFIGTAYDDATTHKHHKQQSWLRWRGIHNRIISSNFIAASEEEKKNLLKDLLILQEYL